MPGVWLRCQAGTQQWPLPRAEPTAAQLHAQPPPMRQGPRCATRGAGSLALRARPLQRLQHAPPGYRVPEGDRPGAKRSPDNCKICQMYARRARRTVSRAPHSNAAACITSSTAKLATARQAASATSASSRHARAAATTASMAPRRNAASWTLASTDIVASAAAAWAATLQSAGCVRSASTARSKPPAAAANRLQGMGAL